MSEPESAVVEAMETPEIPEIPETPEVPEDPPAPPMGDSENENGDGEETPEEKPPCPVILGEVPEPEEPDEPEEPVPDDVDTKEEFKYVFTGDTREYRGRTLRRIIAVRDFGNVKDGEMGGWIESMDNLSHKGSCWVYDEAKVMDNALVTDDAQVRGLAEVRGDASVFDRSRVLDEAVVAGETAIFDSALVRDSAAVGDFSTIKGQARVLDRALVSGADLKNEACVQDDAVVENAEVEGHAYVLGRAEVSGNMVLGGFSRLDENTRLMKEEAPWWGKPHVWVSDVSAEPYKMERNEETGRWEVTVEATCGFALRPVPLDPRANVAVVAGSVRLPEENPVLAYDMDYAGKTDVLTLDATSPLYPDEKATFEIDVHVTEPDLSLLRVDALYFWPLDPALLVTEAVEREDGTIGAAVLAGVPFTAHAAVPLENAIVELFVARRDDPENRYEIKEGQPVTHRVLTGDVDYIVRVTHPRFPTLPKEYVFGISTIAQAATITGAVFLMADGEEVAAVPFMSDTASVFDVDVRPDTPFTIRLAIEPENAPARVVMWACPHGEPEQARREDPAGTFEHAESLSPMDYIFDVVDERTGIATRTYMVVRTIGDDRPDIDHSFPMENEPVAGGEPDLETVEIAVFNSEDREVAIEENEDGTLAAEVLPDGIFRIRFGGTPENTTLVVRMLDQPHGVEPPAGADFAVPEGMSSARFGLVFSHPDTPRRAERHLTVTRARTEKPDIPEPPEEPEEPLAITGVSLLFQDLSELPLEKDENGIWKGLVAPSVPYRVVPAASREGVVFSMTMRLEGVDEELPADMSEYLGQAGIAVTYTVTAAVEDEETKSEIRIEVAEGGAE